MRVAADQIFVFAKWWIVGRLPAHGRPLFSATLSVVPVLLIFPGLFALTTIMERKGIARIQNRFGPNRAGPFGLLQPLADGIKSLTKEDIVPRSADGVIHLLAPLLLVTASFLAYAVLPFGRNMVIANLDAGLLLFFAVGPFVELAIFMAGWSSRSKYSLLGAMRAIAQMISYELPLVLASVVVVMKSGSLSPVAIVEMQDGYTAFLPHWFVFTPWGFVGFCLFMIAAAAESNRAPFDLPEGESELIAGYYIEYSGFKFALFFLGEYLGMFAACGMAITLFLGGWAPPLSFLTWIPSYLWFFAKLTSLIAIFIWVRGTLPRLRMDQLMSFAWKLLLPMSLVNIVAAVAWRYMPVGVVRWLVECIVISLSFVLLARGKTPRASIANRTYRFAE